MHISQSGRLICKYENNILLLMYQDRLASLSSEMKRMFGGFSVVIPLP